MSLTAILIWLLAAVVLVISAALVLPFGLRVEATFGGPIRWKVALQPFGRFGPRFHVPKPDKTKHPAKAKKRKPSRTRPRHPRRIAGAGVRLILDLLSIIRIRQVSIDAKFGCEDPADTGQLFGMIAPLIYGSDTTCRFHVRAEPVFDEPILEGRAMLELVVVPIAIVPPALRFGWMLYGPSR